MTSAGTKLGSNTIKLSSSKRIYTLVPAIFNRFQKEGKTRFFKCYTCGEPIKPHDRIFTNHNHSGHTVRHLKCAEKVHLL